MRSVPHSHLSELLGHGWDEMVLAHLRGLFRKAFSLPGHHFTPIEGDDVEPTTHGRLGRRRCTCSWWTMKEYMSLFTAALMKTEYCRQC